MSSPTTAETPPQQEPLNPAIQKALQDADRGFRTEIDALGDPDRKDRLTKVLDFMIENKMPASSGKSRHGAFDYGLLIHSWMFYRVARSIAVGGLLDQVVGLAETYSDPVIPDVAKLVQAGSSVNQSSILVVSMLHDLNKVVSLNGELHYVPKILKGGKRSEAVPWEVSDKAISTTKAMVDQMMIDGKKIFEPLIDFEDGIRMRDGLTSLIVAEKLSPGIYQTLSADERFSIVYHDGAYPGRTGLQGKETILQQVCHFADMFAARWLA